MSPVWTIITADMRDEDTRRGLGTRIESDGTGSVEKFDGNGAEEGLIVS